MVILLVDGNVRVTLLGEMESCREAKGTSTNDDDRIGLGDAHGRNCRFAKSFLLKIANVDFPTIYTPQPNT